MNQVPGTWYRPESRKRLDLSRFLVRGAGYLVLLASAVSWAGGRPRYGGTLNVTAVTKSVDADPLLADAPVDAALLGLTNTPLCRLVEPSRPSAGTLRLTTAFVNEVAKVLNRVKAEPSPYRALLQPVKVITPSPGAGTVDLSLDGPAPLLEKTLCHPALSVPVAPYVKSEANARHPEGRPYPDAVNLQRTDGRTAERLLGQRRTHLVVGGSGTANAPDAPELFATYVVMSPKVPAALKQAVDATTDRADLTRFFVRPPAQPLFSVLPASLGGLNTAPPRPARPPPQTPAREVALFFDQSNDDHRAIAEKLQVKLQPLGFRLSLRPLSRAELRTQWATGSTELMLQTVLLPTTGPAAAGVLWELSGPKPAPPLDGPVDAATVERLGKELPLIPLCVQGVGLNASNDVQHLTRDTYGLPRLDDVFLSSE